MQNRLSSPVPSAPSLMEGLPRPSGYGFTGADGWSQYTASQSERERLDNLIGLALLDQGVQDRLLVQRDPALLNALDLSDDTRHWLTTIQAATLKEFAQAIVAGSVPYPERFATKAA